MKGFLRKDGRLGIRNRILVVYLVECAHYVAQQIVMNAHNRNAQLIGFQGCAPNDYASMMLCRLCTHPNVGGVLLVSLGCENMDRNRLVEEIRNSSRAVRTIVIQENGGTHNSISLGVQFLKEIAEQVAEDQILADFSFSDLVIGTICGGSDATSGLSANPAVGMAFDELIRRRAICIFEEPGELIGCEKMLASRARNEKVALHLVRTIHKAYRYYKAMGHDSFSAGNGVGGLTTIEEKSLGSYCKSGSALINGVIYPGEQPREGGLYLLDVVPDGEAKWGFPNPNDNAEIIEMIACGAHLILFTTGRGSVVGSAISPVIKVCANPRTFENMQDDMDVNAGKVILGISSTKEVSKELLDLIEQVCSGKFSKSESLEHCEFVLGYKAFDSLSHCR